MHVMAAISVLSFLVLVATSFVIAKHISRTKKNRARAVPAEQPRNLANPL
jgi:hypothetical protein